MCEVRTLKIQRIIQHLLHHRQTRLERVELNILMNKRLVPKCVLALQVLVAQPRCIERYADFVEYVRGEAFLGMACFRLGDLRFLLSAVSDLQLIIDDVDPA